MTKSYKLACLSKISVPSACGIFLSVFIVGCGVGSKGGIGCGFWGSSGTNCYNGNGNPPESALVADAGPIQNIPTGSVVTLDGSKSTGINKEPLTYRWTFASIPTSSTAKLSDAEVVNPTFTADLDGDYIASLVVSDAYNTSAAAYVTITANRPIHQLNLRVIDAEYSKQLDKIIMVSSTPSNQLHIYDPQTFSDTTVNLPLAPSSVSISPDGLSAAVGHNAWISYITLTTATLAKTFSVTTDVLDVVLGGNGYVYAFPRTDQWVQIHCVNLATGVETLSTGMQIYAGTLAKLHPSGTAIYGTDNGVSPDNIEKYDISGGTAAYLYYSPYWGTYPICGDLWMSDDGLRIFTKCGNVFRSSSVKSEDMTYNGSLGNLHLVEYLSQSSSAATVIAIPGVSWYDTGSEDTMIQLYDYTYLAYESSVVLPHFLVNGDGFSGHGRFVFFNSSGSQYFVVIQADSTSGMLYDYGVVTYP